MNNYKIINTHTNEIVKALNELGYVWTPKKFDEQDCLLKAHWILAEQSGAITYSSGTMIDYPLDFQELTLPQLRDLVVLHRNDIHDANWVTEGDDQIYQDSNEKSFIFREQGLISWADALRAFADGKEVEFLHDGHGWVSALGLNIEQVIGGLFKLRLKPRTINIQGVELNKEGALKFVEGYFS